MAERTQNLQDLFLNTVRKSKNPLTIFLINGVKLTGVTVHFVDTGVDTGPIIAQRAVPVLPGDDAATLQHRIQAEEHRLLPRVVRALAAGRITCEGRRVDVATTDHADELL